MRLDDLRFFVRVADLGNLSEAGRQFGLSPSASSARLTTLEKAIGAQLMARSTRQMTLTEAGRLLRNHAQNALDEMDMAFDALDARSDVPRGQLRISSNSFFGRIHILPYLNEFMALYPLVRIDMSFTDRLVDIIGDGFDLAIRNAPLPDSTLMARRLGSNRRVLCASPNYIARRGEPKTPSDLAQHDCIGMSSLPVWHFQGPKGEISHTVSSTITGDNGDYAYDAALLGLGLSVKSVAHVWEDLHRGSLVAVMKDYPITRSGDIWAVYPPARITPPKVAVLIDFLQTKYGKPPYWEQKAVPD